MINITPNFNVVSSPGKRVKLDTGLFCNYKCEFCYYIDHLDETSSYDKIMTRFDELYNCGFRNFDLSGGEPSIHPKFMDILHVISEKGCKVSCLSNGYKFANIDFLQRAKDNGLSEILFSLHGCNSEVHDKITQRKGSFEKIIRAINNCHKLNIKVRLNCTLYNFNFKYIPDYIELINKLNTTQINFILLNYNVDQIKHEPISIEDISKELEKNLDKITCKDVRIRYVPFCYFKNDTDKVYNYLQHIFDQFDWSPLHSYTDSKNSIDTLVKDNIDHVLKTRERLYTKKKECYKCKYYYICDGLKKSDKNNNVYPINGEKIKSL